MNPVSPVKKTTNWPAWIGIVLTALSMMSGTFVYAFSVQDELKEWTYQKTSDTKLDIINSVSENYVRKSEFAKLEQCMVDQKEDMKELKAKIDKLLEISMKKH